RGVLGKRDRIKWFTGILFQMVIVRGAGSLGHDVEPGIDSVTQRRSSHALTHYHKKMDSEASDQSRRQQHYVERIKTRQSLRPELATPHQQLRDVGADPR